MSGELVSVVVPAYNAAAYIGRTLASVLNQTHTNLEVLVVDDGSTDATAEEVLAVASEDQRVRLISQSNAGVAAARNRAISEAAGTLLAPIDADDLWRRDKIARQVEALENTPTAAMAYCWHTRIDEQDGIIGPFDFRPRFAGDQQLPVVALQNIVGASVPLMRTDLVRSLGGYDPSLRYRGGQGSEDWLLFCRMAAAAGVALVPAFMVGYRQVPASMSRDTDRALASHLVATAEIARMHPGLDRQILIWSETIHALWLAANHARESQLSAAARMVWWVSRRQWAADRLFLARRPFSRYVRFRVLRASRRFSPGGAHGPVGVPFLDADFSGVEAAVPGRSERARYEFMRVTAGLD